VQPKVYTSDFHNISSQQIDSHARYVIQELRQAGHKAYLVGGGVRDLLLKRRPKDFDISTSAKPEEIRAIFRNAILIGRRFRLAHIRFGKKIIEVATFRAGETSQAHLILRDNVWGTEEEDVLRRDFTINGLLYDPETGEIIDYVDGYLDLSHKILRTIGEPSARFSQDPVRMIRLLKFCARFQFTIDAPTLEALLLCKGEIVKSSSARILEELLRMLESGAAKPFFHLLQEYGLLHSLLPELAHFFTLHADNRVLPLLGEIDDEIQKHSETPLDRSLLLAGLIFPLFDEYLKVHRTHGKKAPHLGEIDQAAHYVIDCLFSSFFQLPRRMRAMIGFLLTHQYRLVPLDGKIPRRLRAPRDGFFPMAIKLLKFRAAIQPELLPHYLAWSEASLASRSV
jgi:poly(A) polymerase